MFANDIDVDKFVLFYRLQNLQQSEFCVIQRRRSSLRYTNLRLLDSVSILEFETQNREWKISNFYLFVVSVVKKSKSIALVK